MSILYHVLELNKVSEFIPKESHSLFTWRAMGKTVELSTCEKIQAFLAAAFAGLEVFSIAFLGTFAVFSTIAFTATVLTVTIGIGLVVMGIYLVVIANKYKAQQVKKLEVALDNAKTDDEALALVQQGIVGQTGDIYHPRLKQACKNGWTKTAEALLFRKLHCTALHEAAKNNQVEIIEVLANRDFHLDEYNGDDYTPLTVASYHGHLASIHALLKAGASINHCDTRGHSFLYYLPTRIPLKDLFESGAVCKHVHEPLETLIEAERQWTRQDNKFQLLWACATHNEKWILKFFSSQSKEIAPFIDAIRRVTSASTHNWINSIIEANKKDKASQKITYEPASRISEARQKWGEASEQFKLYMLYITRDVVGMSAFSTRHGKDASNFSDDVLPFISDSTREWLYTLK